MDKLSEKLEEIILKAEELLWLNTQNELGLVYSQADLQPVLSQVRNQYLALPAVAKSTMAGKASSILDPLYKISAVSQFKDVKRLNYHDYANMDFVRDVLLLFTVEASINKTAINSCNIIAAVLSNIDETRPKYKFSLSYKYLRMFLLFTMIGDFVSSSCLAYFILTQLGD